MFSNVFNNNLDEKEKLMISLNRKIPMEHLNLVNQLDAHLDDCIVNKYEDISNMVYLAFGIKYDSSLIQSILNLLKSKQTSLSLFSTIDPKVLIRNYSKNHRVLTLASLHTIKPFTLHCLECKKPLKLQFKENVNVFHIDRVENGVIYIGYCCSTNYYSNSFVRMSKRFVVPGSIYNQKYIHFGGKCVLNIDLLLRYASDLVNMVN
jgi:hypothetical protein